jgi:uncharacterized protein with LGFP repeats
LPTSDETSLSAVRYGANFEGGVIEWSWAGGAHAVYGAIEAEYAATAGERDYHGTIVHNIPTSDEMNVPGVPGARMNTFQCGASYWSPSTGAHVVYGATGDLYQSMGGPTSYLGLPTSDEQGIPGGRVSYFEHGKILWSPNGGAHAVQNADYMVFDTGTSLSTTVSRSAARRSWWFPRMGPTA